MDKHAAFKAAQFREAEKSAFSGVQHEKNCSDYGLEALEEGSVCSGLVALRMLGDAMAPRILDGDIALIAREMTVRNGEIAAVSVDKGRAEICRLLWQGGGFCCARKICNILCGSFRKRGGASLYLGQGCKDSQKPINCSI